MSVIEAVQAFVKTYPPLADDRIDVDFLPAEVGGYSVDVVPTKETIKQYMDGSSVREFLFVLASRTEYGSNIRQQLDNSGFFEDFAAWINTQNRARNFPDLGSGRMGQKLEVTTSGYIFAQDTDAARYQIQCRLTYIQKGAR